MIKANKHSIAGIFLAIFSVAVLAGTGILAPLFANGLGGAPRELRLGAELGLIEVGQCNNKFLKGNLTKKAFSAKLAIVMNTLGVQNPDAFFLYNNGITDNTNQNSSITRGEAVEMMARAVMYMNKAGIFKMPVGKAVNFKDYRIPEKYVSPFAYMQNKFVVRGLSSNNLGAKKKLSHRESVYFLFRLYEAISADMMSTKANEGLCFIDISLGHPIMDSIRNLTAAGAFDRAILRPSFDGDSFISPDDLTEIIGGIFDRSGREFDMLRLQTIFHDREAYTSRKEMALVLEFLLDSFTESKDNYGQVDYVDVSNSDVEYQALSKLAARQINPGYGNRVFAADENITWFETVSLLDQTLQAVTGSKVSKKPNKELEVAADKEDFERLKNILIKKKAMIRNILGPKPEK